MKRYILILLAMVIIAGNSMTAANYKVVDRSAKKAPEWLHDLPKGTILVEVERPTLGEAQSDAELEILKRIISAVATNINHSSTSEASETLTNDGHDYMESFFMQTQTNAATLPFLKGVSLSRANGTYWEKREEKNTKRPYVVFSVCYPLTSTELAEMTAQFEKLDQSKTEELAQLREGIAGVSSSDEIQDAIGRLEALQAYFFDKVRLAETKAVTKSYQELYKGLTMDGEFVGGKLVVRVLLNGKPFKVTARPYCKSNCASGIIPTHTNGGESIVIKYNSEDCLDNEENWIEVALRVKSARLRERFIMP